MSDPLLPAPRTDRNAAATPKPVTEPMIDEARSADGVAISASPRSSQRGASGATRVMLIGVVVLCIAVAFAAWYDVRQNQQLLRTQVAQRLADVDAMTQAAGKAQTQVTTELRDAQAKIALLEARLAESQAQQAALEALYRDIAPSRDEIALTEIEQVLLVASQQLQLAGNVQSALAALQLADAKLQRLDRPQFLPLRRALSRDIDRLKAMPFVDVDGMSLKLDQAMPLVAALPLAMDERVPIPGKSPASTLPPAESSWQKFLREVWADITQLVRVEVADRAAAPFLAPTQQYFLRENLKLRLLSARVALINRDDSTFKADIATAESWLKQYFDTRAKPVQTMQSTLKQLAATPMAGDMPDLVGSLEALRTLRLAQERAPGRNTERAAGTASSAQR